MLDLHQSALKVAAAFHVRFTDDGHPYPKETTAA